MHTLLKRLEVTNESPMSAFCLTGGKHFYARANYFMVEGSETSKSAKNSFCQHSMLHSWLLAFLILGIYLCVRSFFLSFLLRFFHDLTLFLVHRVFLAERARLSRSSGAR